MIQILKNFERTEVERVLSSLTGALLPNPYSSRSLGEIDKGIYAQVLEEIQDRLELDPLDPTPSTRARVFEFLFNEMKGVALAETDIDQVKMRLGQKGLLRPDLYKIEFLDVFKMSEVHGVRPSHVEEVLRHPDEVEHLKIDPYSEQSQEYSIYFKIQNKLSSKDRFYLLVMAHRQGYVQAVFGAFRVYESEVDLSQAHTPLDILKAFLVVYGVTMRIGLHRSILFMQEAVEVEPGVAPEDLIHLEKPDDVRTLQLGYVLKAKIHNMYFIPMAFTINSDKYASDLRKHGVHVDIRSFPPMKIYFE